MVGVHTVDALAVYMLQPLFGISGVLIGTYIAQFPTRGATF